MKLKKVQWCDDVMQGLYGNLKTKCQDVHSEFFKRLNKLLAQIRVLTMLATVKMRSVNAID